MCHGMVIPLLGFTVVNPVGIPLDRPSSSTIVVLILKIYDIYVYYVYIYILQY